MHNQETWLPTKVHDVLIEVFSGAWGNEPSTFSQNAKVLRSTDIDDDGHIDYKSGAERNIASSILMSKRLKKNDILLEVSGGGPAKPVGRVAFFNSPFDDIYLCSNFFRTLRTSKAALPKFLLWRLLLLYTEPKIWSFQQQTTGIINLKTTEYLKQTIMLPPLKEQQILSAILDTLDTQIQQTERLVAKLKQIKVGLLHDLLTRGIDDNGDVRDPIAHPEEFKEEYFLQKRIKLPKKWEIQPLKTFLVGIDAGKSPNCPDQPAGAGDWGILKVSAIHPTGFRSEENKVIINPAYINPAYEVHDGDLLISRANTYELVGIVCLVSEPRPQLLLCDKTLRLQVNPKNALSEFIFYMLQMPFVRAQIEMHATGSSASMKNISQSSIKNLAILAPSKEEQKAIIAVLNAHDARITAEETELAKLKQINKGLMHDLLTGHVRVTPLMAESEQLDVVRSKDVSGQGR